MALVTVYKNGKKLQVSERRLEAAKKNGWKPKDEEPTEPDEGNDEASYTDGYVNVHLEQENNSWQE